MKPLIIISHPNGNANTRGAVYAMNRMGMLYRFITSIAVFNSGFWRIVALLPGLKTFMRKRYDDSIQKQTVCYPFKELGRQICAKLKWHRFIEHETGMFCIDRGCEYIDMKTAYILSQQSSNIDAAYCYEDVALNTFRIAKLNGIHCIYDLPIGHWRAMRELLEEERKKNPEWAITLDGFKDSEEKLLRKDEELRLADKIYVASSFTKWSLKDFPTPLTDIEVIPYGFPPVNRERVYQPFNGRKIKVLYVGGLSQRKGISYLFDAVSGLDDKIELTVVGLGNIDKCPALYKALKRVNYIPSLPHNEILKLMATHDVFVFPSLFEGFGLVITEAMSQGTPVITTNRTCGPDIMTSGKDGWIVDAGTSVPIKKLLESFISNPDILQKTGKAAKLTAAQRPWVKYEKELAESIQNFVKTKSI